MSHHVEALNAENGANSPDSAAQGAAVGAANAPLGDDLAVIVSAWPTLPKAIKAGILAMIGTAQ